LAQQGAEAANFVVAEKSANGLQREPSVGHNDQARHARSEAASSASPNRHLAENDARRCITQNCNTWEYGRNRDDLRNIIEDQRCIRDRSPSQPQQFPARGVTAKGRSGFRSLAGPLREVRWPAKFKAGHIDQYESSSNPEEFIQVYQTIIEAADGDDRVKANFLHTTLSRVARSWRAMFIGNFQGTYERLSTAETLKTIKQKQDESLHDYVKHFCNTKNDIPHIQDIEIINAFHDGINDVKTVEEIAMKKPKTAVDLLVVADICIEASKTRARLLEYRGKGPSTKRDDREVNTAERGDQKDRGGHQYRGKQFSDQKERRPF
jgi:hypothetical protein